MKNKPAVKLRKRRGTIAVLAAIMMTMLLGMAAFSVDLGYILTARTDLQAAADAAALAAVRELLPDATGSQYLGIPAARARAREYASRNVGAGTTFQIPDADIEIGRYDRDTIYSGGPVILLNTGIFDTVRVTLRQDGVHNDKIPLFFAQALGFAETNLVASATAILPPVKELHPGDGILPFAVDIHEWDKLGTGESVSIYGDGHIEDSGGTTVPGNWGTVDVGAEANSTADIGQQVDVGLRQKDLDALATSIAPATNNPRIPNNVELEAPLWVNSETGLSASLQSSLQGLIAPETPKIIPLFDVVTGTGDGAEFHIVGWGVVAVTAADLSGAKKFKHLTIERRYAYVGTLTPVDDLSDTDVVWGVFGGAILVE